MSDRLFFALWPDDALRESLEHELPALVRDISGKAQRPDQWHVTLEFLGSVPADRQSAVRAAPERVAVEAFEVNFDAVDHWRRPQVYCLAATETPPALARLVTELRAALWAQGFVPESRDYRPHVTLARKVRAAMPAPLATPIRWPADRFALVRSVTEPAGSRYEPVQWWNLRPGDR
jgi:RNA 2',3'-cyclic 3'-phosphodiesterase